MRTFLKATFATTLVLSGAAFAIGGCSSNDQTPPPAETDGGPDAKPDVNPPPPPPPVDAGPDGDASVEAVDAPTLTPAPGKYSDAQQVAIATTTAGATIYYTLDGTDPTESSAKYASPIAISKTTTVKAIAKKSGLKDSSIVTGAYTIEIAQNATEAPTFKPAAGAYANDQSVTITTGTAGAKVCTTSGTAAPACAPTGGCAQGSTEVTAPVTVKTDTTLHAIACKAGATPSKVVDSAYTFQAAAPTFDIKSGTVFDAAGGAITVRTETIGGTIRYTLDGTDPSCNAGTNVITEQQKALAPFTQNTTIKAIGCKDGYKPSDVVVGEYQVRAGTPSLSPAAGTYKVETEVKVTQSSDPGTWTCLTADAKAPVAPECGAAAGECKTGTKDASFTVKETGTKVQAISCRPDHAPSVLVSNAYVLQPAAPTFDPPTNTVIAQDTTVKIASAGATEIAATDDGTEPSCAKTTVVGTDGTIAVTAHKGSTIRAIGCKASFTPSAEAAAVYPAKGGLAAPQVAPAAGDYVNDVTVGISTLPVDAKIYFTLDGSDPACAAGSDKATHGTAFDASKAPVLSKDTTVKAIACKAGNDPSPVVPVRYAFHVDDVTITPATGELAVGGSAAFASKTNGVTFHYSDDRAGADPTCATAATGATYTGIASEFAYGLRVIACKDGYAASKVTSAVYTAVVGAPELKVAAGAAGKSNVTFSDVSSKANRFQICYTVDGSTPDCDASLRCTAIAAPGKTDATALSSNAGQTIEIDKDAPLKAMACADKLKNSAVTSISK